MRTATISLDRPKVLQLSHIYIRQTTPIYNKVLLIDSQRPPLAVRDLRVRYDLTAAFA